MHLKLDPEMNISVLQDTDQKQGVMFCTLL